MREIKFRGKRIDNGEWVVGDYSRYSKEASIIMVDLLEEEDYWVSNETVGQYTGLKDKNGVEIYEGDRLKRIGDDGDEIFIIEWNEQSGGFNLNYIYLDEKYDLEELWPDSQVIGNIHDKEGDEYKTEAEAIAAWNRRAKPEDKPIDVVPVVRGEWVEAKSGVMSVYPPGQVMCSVCKQRMPSQWKKMPPYCYGCGAKMEGKPCG